MLVVVFVIVMFLASLLQAVVGFGRALVVVPLALLFLSKETVVCSMFVVGLSLNGFLSARIRASISPRLVSILLVASLFGLPVGLSILRAIPMSSMKVFVGCLVVLFAILLWWGKLRLPQNGPWTALAGFLSGVLNTSTSMSGPPVLILLAGQGLPKDQFRRTLSCYFLVSDVVAAVMLVLSGVMTVQTVSYGVAAVPFVFLAGYVGDRISARLPERPFRVLALIVLFLAGVYSVASGLA